jgi:hypothetical protein
MRAGNVQPVNRLHASLPNAPMSVGHIQSVPTADADQHIRPDLIDIVIRLGRLLTSLTP